MLLAALPAGAQPKQPTDDPFFVGGVEDDGFGGHIWFNYRAGRDAQHITSGTYLVEIDDRSPAASIRGSFNASPAGLAA